MPEKEADGPDAAQRGVQISAVFAVEYMVRPDYRATLVTRVLNEFRNLPDSVRNALKSAVNDTISLPTGGFRRGQAGRALEGLHTVLQEPIESEVRFSDKLASAVLRGWAESHAPLREEVARHLERNGLNADGPNFAQNRFHTVWEPTQWESELEEFTQANDQFSRDDAGLMLCYVSGKLPFLEPDEKAVSAVVSETLDSALAYLCSLPPTAPEWWEVIPNFIESVSGIVKAKEAELRWASDFDTVLQSLRNDFPDLLAFFEQDTQLWAAARVSPEADTAAALRSAERLHSLLAEYQPVHDRAPGISEERERISRRGELQPPILETMQEIDRLMTEDSGSSGDGPSAQPERPPTARTELDEGRKPKPVHPEPAEGREQQSTPETAPAAPLPESAVPLPAEPPGVTAADYDALQSESHSLRDDAQALRSENQDLRDEVEALKTELYSSQEMEESWRLAYRSAMDGSLEEEEVPPPVIASVNEAVEIAKSKFRQELLFSPNSESNIESNPYIYPEKVWEALQWLATTYYPSKMGRLRVTDFDQSIREACGWWYKGDQGETTLSRYEKSYTTRVEGRRHWLEEHIGKGTSFDARYTIRIAFDWDRERRRVIVGYIGRHQQTDAS